MRVISKLAQVDFRFGEVTREGDLLVIDSHPDSKMQSTIYISPRDVVELLKRFLLSPSAILFVLCLPYFLYRWNRSDKRIARSRRHVRKWPEV